MLCGKDYLKPIIDGEYLALNNKTKVLIASKLILNLICFFIGSAFISSRT